MKTIYFFISLLFFFSLAKSQNVISLQDPVSGKLFTPEKYSAIRGTPFLLDKWVKGSVTTLKGIYQEVELKYNVYDNILFFKKGDETYAFQENVLSFTLKPRPKDSTSYMVYVKGIPGTDFRDNQYIRVLLDGAISLYKLDLKQLSEMSEINAGMIKTFTHNAKYYIGMGGKLTFIKLAKADLLSVLSDKQEALETYISKHSLSFKKEADVILLLKYYATL